LYKKAREKAAKKGKKLKWFNFPPYLVMFLGGFLTMPTLFFSSAFKLFSVEDRTIAVDPLISFMMTVAVS